MVLSFSMREYDKIVMMFKIEWFCRSIFIVVFCFNESCFLEDFMLYCIFDYYVKIMYLNLFGMYLLYIFI